MSGFLEDAEKNFEKARAEAHKRELERLEKERVKKAQQAAQAAKEANENFILW